MATVRKPSEILQKLKDENVDTMKSLTLKERVDMYNDVKISNKRMQKIITLCKAKRINIDYVLFKAQKYVKTLMAV